MTMSEPKRKYRSSAWFGPPDKDGFIHRSWVGRGLPEGIVRRPADHRHLQHLVGADPVQRAFPRACRARQARRLGSRRRAVRVSGDVARRNQRAADRHALPQPRQHGRRGVDPRQPDRRRRPALRLRQDDAGAGHGRGELRPARDRRLRRDDAQWQVSRQADIGSGTDVWRFSEEVQRRRDERARVHAGGILHVPLVGDLQRHGHGLDDGGRWWRRSAWRCRRTPPSRRSTRGG